MYDIAIYYPTRYSKSFRFAEELRSGIERGKLKGASIPIFRFNDNYQEPLGKYTASKLKIPSVQLEVTQDIRESDILRNTLIENMVILLESKSIK